MYRNPENLCLLTFRLENIKKDLLISKSFFPVGARGFEPPTSCTPCKRASRSAPRPEDDRYYIIIF